MALNGLVINGSYRSNGIIHHAVDAIAQALSERGHDSRRFDLIDCDIRFCTNCRRCMQLPGNEPGLCPLEDSMRGLIDEIETADFLVLASPVNFGCVTAVYKRFLERLAVYGYWPWGARSPEFRKRNRNKQAILITSSAMPGFFARLTTHAMSTLRYTAKTVGAVPAAQVYLGGMALSKDRKFSPKELRKLIRAAGKIKS